MKEVKHKTVLSSCKLICTSWAGMPALRILLPVSVLGRESQVCVHCSWLTLNGRSKGVTDAFSELLHQ